MTGARVSELFFTKNLNKKIFFWGGGKGDARVNDFFFFLGGGEEGTRVSVFFLQRIQILKKKKILFFFVWGWVGEGGVRWLN